MHKKHTTPTLRPNEATPSTDRWTSPAYRVKFKTINHLNLGEVYEHAFDMSAWGLSSELRNLLADYKDWQIHQAAEWLTIHQNALVAEIIEDVVAEAQERGEILPPLQNLYIAVDGELYLPHGLKMPVCCVTNIVPNPTNDDGMDKFVAVLDRGEVQLYINERTFINTMSHSNKLH